jgi:hypothetical protein
MRIRWARGVPLVVVLVAAELQALFVAGDDISFGMILAGALVGIALGSAVLSLAWVLGGGDVCAVVVGLGGPLRYWRTSSGRIVRLSWLPISVSAGGYAAREGWPPRAPFVASVLASSLLGLGGLAALLTARSGFPLGVGMVAFVLGAGMLLLNNQPGAPLPGARSTLEAGRRAHLTPVALAGGRRDYPAILALTTNLPTPPEHWTDTLLAVLRAGALCNLHRAGDAVRLLRASLVGAPDRLVPLLQVGLVNALFEALVRGEVGAPDVPAVLAEIRHWGTAATGKTRNRCLELMLRAQLAYVSGNYPLVIRSTLAAVPMLPPGSRANAYALVSLAHFGNRDLPKARLYLTKAQRDDPSAPMLAPATYALSALPTPA